MEMVGRTATFCLDSSCSFVAEVNTLEPCIKNARRGVDETRCADVAQPGSSRREKTSRARKHFPKYGVEEKRVFIIESSAVHTSFSQKGVAIPNQVPALTSRLKSLGFTLGNRMRLYGEMFEMAGDPIIVDETLVLVDAIQTKSGERRRVRIPLPILKMAAERAA